MSPMCYSAGCSNDATKSVRLRLNGTCLIHVCDHCLSKYKTNDNLKCLKHHVDASVEKHRTKAQEE
jgi:hypothetical protein